jgi:mono/diheme cytochrome c family protein
MVAFLAAFVLLVVSGPHLRADPLAPSVTIEAQGTRESFTAAQLFARPDIRVITIEDIHYRKSMQYRAIRLQDLSNGLSVQQDGVVEAKARDGFVAEIPARLFSAAPRERSIPWIAVEDSADPWPNFEGRPTGAGPFYLVWERPLASGVAAEQWTYNLASLSIAQTPSERWPQLKVDAALPADDPARKGQQIFEQRCIACHRLNNGGASAIGPDLNLPMNPTEYLTPAGLRALIRNPKAVRTWPEQQMIGFQAADLSDRDLDDLIAYLRHMSDRKIDLENHE